MIRKIRLVVGGVLLAGGFLLGFVPHYLKAKALDSQLGAARQQLNAERERSQMEELGLLCGHVYLETSLKNYGLAGRYSTQFFDGVQAMMSQAQDSNGQPFLQETLAQRDVVTGGLAQGDAGTLPAVQEMFKHALEAAESKSK